MMTPFFGLGMLFRQRRIAMRTIGLGLACMLLLTSCSSSEDTGASGLREKLLGILHEYDEAVKRGHWQRQREVLHPKELDVLDAAMSFHGVKVDENRLRENPPHGSSELAEALASPEKIAIEQDGSWARLVYPLKGGRGIVLFEKVNSTWMLVRVCKDPNTESVAALEAAGIPVNRQTLHPDWPYCEWPIRKELLWLTDVRLIARTMNTPEAESPEVQFAVQNVGSHPVPSEVLRRFFSEIDYKVSGPGEMRPYSNLGHLAVDTTFPEQLLPGQELGIAPSITIRPESDFGRTRLTGTFRVQWLCGALLSNELSVEVK